jgi:hypothetical protein
MAKKKYKKAGCISIGFILCGKPLENVLGYIGRKKINLGTKITKHHAVAELLSIGDHYTEDEIRTGTEISNKRVK